MTTEDFAVQLMWLLIFVMIFVGSLCLLDVLFAPRKRRDYRMPMDFNDDRRAISRAGFKSRMGTK